MQIGEWAAAITCWALIACIGVVAALRPRKAQEIAQPSHWFLRTLGAVFSLLIAIMLIAITDLRKPEAEPWSNLAKAHFLHRKEDHSGQSANNADVQFLGGFNVRPPDVTPPKRPEKLSLYWLFKEDFPNSWVAEIETRIRANGRDYKIESAILIDFEERSRFVNFFIPDDADAYEVGKVLPEASDLLIQYFNSTHKFQAIGTFDKANTSFSDLTSTGRIFVYYEGLPLTLPQASELDAAFGRYHYGLVLRGDDWLRMNIAQNPPTAPKPPSTNEPRTYLVLDGNIQFPRDVTNGTMGPERTFKVGEQLFFNYFLKADGPNPIQVFISTRRIYIRTDDSDATQRAIIDDFKRMYKRDRRVLPRKSQTTTPLCAKARMGSSIRPSHTQTMAGVTC